MLDLSTEVFGDVLVIDVAPDSVAHSVSEELIFQLNDSGCRKVVLDFSSLMKTTSEILGDLVAFRTYCEVNGIALKLSGLDETLKSLLDVTGLRTLFKSYSTVNSAVEKFNADSYLRRQEFFSEYDKRFEEESEFESLARPKIEPNLVFSEFSNSVTSVELF